MKYLLTFADRGDNALGGLSVLLLLPVARMSLLFINCLLVHVVCYILNRRSLKILEPHLYSPVELANPFTCSRSSALTLYNTGQYEHVQTQDCWCALTVAYISFEPKQQMCGVTATKHLKRERSLGRFTIIPVIRVNEGFSSSVVRPRTVISPTAWYVLGKLPIPVWTSNTIDIKR